MSVIIEKEYGLPEQYQETQLTLLPQDPHCLYAYWEISEEDIRQFKVKMGPEIWEKSVPALKITNVSRSSHSYIRINDFSESWYIRVQDAGCLYFAEIGRKLTDGGFIRMAASNYSATPLDTVGNITEVRFADYRTLQASSPESGPEAQEIYIQGGAVPEFAGRPGTSSLEFMNLNPEHMLEGVSSMEIAVPLLREYLGISSDMRTEKP